jgi:hypothetical protein
MERHKLCRVQNITTYPIIQLYVSQYYIIIKISSAFFACWASNDSVSTDVTSHFCIISLSNFVCFSNNEEGKFMKNRHIICTSLQFPIPAGTDDGNSKCKCIYLNIIILHLILRMYKRV